MKTIYAAKPGVYKKVKTYEKGRVCECGARLSVYNHQDVCYTCSRT